MFYKVADTLEWSWFSHESLRFVGKSFDSLLTVVIFIWVFSNLKICTLFSKVIGRGSQCCQPKSWTVGQSWRCNRETHILRRIPRSRVFAIFGFSRNEFFQYNVFSVFRILRFRFFQRGIKNLVFPLHQLRYCSHFAPSFAFIAALEHHLTHLRFLTFSTK